ncbi:hypothetical protein [Streptomyces sp. NPDC051098]|uniref:hypothetical protein n=1 Tax=Streptomyces sp. NPDC051098 TaxID=3155411 RepID=UPI0034359D3E
MSDAWEDRSGTRLPEGVPPMRPRWLPRIPDGPDQGPWRRRSNQLLYVLALAGMGASVWAFWLTLEDMGEKSDSKDRIAEACAGLVDAEAVLSLRGGVVRTKTDSGADSVLRIDSLPSACRIYGVPESGGSDGLFSLVVRTAADGRPLHVVGDESSLEPFQNRLDRNAEDEDATRTADRAEPHPLGDGALGDYDHGSVTVRAVCTSGKPAALSVTARADYEDVSDQDRRTLAEVAHGAAVRAAAGLKCDARLSALPSRLPTPDRELGDPKSAKASCGWYRGYLGRTARGRLPDRVLEAPLGAMSSTESCLLAVSPSAVGEIADDLQGPDRTYAEPALTHSPWWMRTSSYLGTDAESVGHSPFADTTFLKPGTAGGDEGAGVWWASSVCDGRPALHALTVSYTYDGVVSGRMAGLLRAYVDDVTKRRGCTDVVFPPATAFARK